MNPFQQRIDLIDRYSNRFQKNTIQWQNAVFDALTKIYFPKLDTENGVVSVTTSNIQFTSSSINKAFEIAKQETGNKIVGQFLKDLFNLQKANERFFDDPELSKDKSLDAISKKVINKMNKRLGINSNGVSGNGYLGDIFAMEEVIAKVRKEAMKAVVSNQSRQDIERTLSLIMKGGKTPDGKEREGVMYNYMRTNVFDTFAQYDRSVSLEYADELKLNYAVYQGGLIKTSRPFCKERNGKVFTREEIAKWVDLDFQGKPSNYDPFRDLGGYNCRHILRWISDQRARRLLEAA